MARNMENVLLPAGKFESSTTKTVEIIEIDDMEQKAILHFIHTGGFKQPAKRKSFVPDIKTCM